MSDALFFASWHVHLVVEVSRSCVGNDSNSGKDSSLIGRHPFRNFDTHLRSRTNLRFGHKLILKVLTRFRHQRYRVNVQRLHGKTRPQVE